MADTDNIKVYTFDQILFISFLSMKQKITQIFIQLILFQMAFREVEQTVKNLKIEATGNVKYSRIRFKVKPKY